MINTKRSLSDAYLLFILVPIAAVAIWSLGKLHESSSQDIKNSLETVLQTNKTALLYWKKDLEATAQTIADIPAARRRSTLAAHGILDAIIINRDDRSNDAITNAFAGQTTLTLPYLTHHKGQEKARMAVVTPLRDRRKKIIAVLALILDPSQNFSSTLQLGRLGKTGETYAFDRHGKLLSESRFDADLIKMGLLKQGQSSALSITLFDPVSPKSQRRLTLMAQSATRGHTETNVTGYRDYRGIEVVGSWTWINELGFGLTTEIDKHEAYRSYRIARIFVISVLAISLISAALATLILVARKRALQRTLQTRDDFVSIVSHEIRNPLTSLKFILSMLTQMCSKLGTNADPQLSRMIRMASNQIDFLIHVSINLLNVTQIRIGRFSLNPESFDLAVQLRSWIADIADEFNAAGCVLSVESPSSVTGQWDRQKLQQAVMNLLINAKKFGREKAIGVHLHSTEELVSISVVDQGVGISTEEQKNIFNKFERGSARPGTPGMGLGLYITREIVKAHNGRIEVSSEPGKGATFTLTLPRRQSVIPESAQRPGLRTKLTSVSKRIIGREKLY